MDLAVPQNTKVFDITLEPNLFNDDTIEKSVPSYTDDSYQKVREQLTTLDKNFNVDGYTIHVSLKYEFYSKNTTIKYIRIDAPGKTSGSYHYGSTMRNVGSDINYIFNNTTGIKLTITMDLDKFIFKSIETSNNNIIQFNDSKDTYMMQLIKK